MRELLFRVWDGEDMLVFPDIKEWDIEDYDDFSRLTQKGKPVMQYAGLKDKNGKEIYEGDIVGSENILTPGAPIMCDCYSWSVGDGWPMYEYFSQYGNDLRIIGNIHESPELLEER